LRLFEKRGFLAANQLRPFVAAVALVRLDVAPVDHLAAPAAFCRNLANRLRKFERQFLK